MFGLEAQAKADEILGGGKFAPGYERTYWEGCTHGFAVRGDMVSWFLVRRALVGMDTDSFGLGAV